jgi:hypothetical protein
MPTTTQVHHLRLIAGRDYAAAAGQPDVPQLPRAARTRIRAAARRAAFFMNHHPILAFAPNPARPDAPFRGTRGIAVGAADAAPTVLFPPTVQALLAGHVHLFRW